MTVRFLTARGWAVDGPDVRCGFHMWDCSTHAAGAGGFHEHHEWPTSMGGPEHPDDLLYLCPLHHSRQHSLIRHFVDHGLAAATLRWFSPLERAIARHAVEQWALAGRPRITGWSTPPAAPLQ